MLALCAFGPAGCLVAEAPDYGPARQTAPVVDPDSITPKPYLQFEMNLGETRDLNFRFTSEDAGEELTVVGYYNYQSPEPREVYIRDFDIAPQPFDQPKTVRFPFTPVSSQVSPGCHSLTVLLMHESTWNSFERELIEDRAADDLTVVTWFFFAKDATNPGVSVPCPGGPDLRMMQ